MNDPLDPHSLVPLQKVLDENSLKPLDYFRAYLEDRAPAVILFDGGLYVVKSDLHSWKRRLRAASFTRKAEVLGAGAFHG